MDVRNVHLNNPTMIPLQALLESISTLFFIWCILLSPLLLHLERAIIRTNLYKLQVTIQMHKAIQGLKVKNF